MLTGDPRIYKGMLGTTELLLRLDPQHILARQIRARAFTMLKKYYKAYMELEAVLSPLSQAQKMHAEEEQF